MKRSLIVFCLLLLLLAASTAIYALTAEEIIEKRDNNEYIETARAEMEMIIRSGRREMIKTMVSLTDRENSLTEFTNPRDRGTKFLKRGDELWMFFPEAEELVKISGHMLSEGMMGSDFSYRDVMESDKLTDLYDFELIGEEELDGRICYVLEGIAREGKDVSYYRRKSWIDKEHFAGLKEEYYAQSGRLLKEMKVLELEEKEGRWYPVRTIMENRLRKDSSTEVIIKSIEFNPEIAENTFTLEKLQ